MLVNDVSALMSIGVDELQIESLKVLPGTRMRNDAERLGLKYSPLPPYEVLRTPVMTPEELRYAMKISRMVDFYYNAPAWQDVLRDLVEANDGFIRDFTSHLDQIMVLNSPLSQERRGVILYEYCSTHHPDALTAISLAWIKAGFSLHKKPAGNILKIKNLVSEFDDPETCLDIVYGTAESSHRYFLLETSSGGYLFGYDSQLHQPAPVFMAKVK